MSVYDELTKRALYHQQCRAHADKVMASILEHLAGLNDEVQHSVCAMVVTELKIASQTKHDNDATHNTNSHPQGPPKNAPRASPRKPGTP